MQIIILLLIIVLYTMSVQRRLVSAKENINNAFSQIGVNQESRWDALTQLAKATAAYSNHEYKAMMDIIDKRKAPTSVEMVDANEKSINSALGHINVVAEQYPDLKASQVYQTTMNSINDYENKVRVARMIYNDSVTILNRIVKQIPSSIIASLFGFSEAPYLETINEKTEMPDLKF